ncbi:MAG: cation:proton antiporter [Bdellovibrionales bacterium]|nr:cation:proton antiporter [Bdellovibrionales bacterium]
MSLVIIGLSLLFFLGHALNWFFIKTKIPDLLILVVLGYIIGPTLGLIQASDLGMAGSVLSTTALIVILYEGGLNLSARDLLTSSLPALKLSLVGFLLIASAGAVVAWGIGFQESWTIAALLGICIGSTSSAIVIPMVKPLSIKKKTKTLLSLESAFTDVLAIILFLGLVESAAVGVYDPLELALGIGSNPLISLAIGISAALFWALAKKRFSFLVDMTFAGEAWALLIYGSIEFMGYNGAIGVLSLGFALANLDLLPKFIRSQISAIPISFEDLSLLSEITFLLRTFFFLYLGILIQFSSLSTVLVAIVLSLLIIVTRFLAIRLLFKPADYPRLDAMVSVAMGPRGLACAVLATIPLQKGIEGGEWLQNVAFALIPMTITLTALFVSLCESDKLRQKISQLFMAYPDEADKKIAQAENTAEPKAVSEQTDKTEEPQTAESKPPGDEKLLAADNSNGDSEENNEGS